jgi:hypothetical protein
MPILQEIFGKLATEMADFTNRAYFLNDYFRLNFCFWPYSEYRNATLGRPPKVAGFKRFRLIFRNQAFSVTW